MPIYLDLVMLLNGSVDFLLLLGTNRLAGFPSRPGRLALAAVLGGIYGGACLAPGFSFLGSLPWRLVSLAAMAGIAFGWSRSGLKRGGIFALLSMAMGGLALSLGRSDVLSLTLCAGGIFVLCRFALAGCMGENRYVPLELCYGERRIRVLALRDTGNQLRDPITGEQVLILSAQAATQLTGLTPMQLRDPLSTLAGSPLPGLRLIPYRAVGVEGGLLLAMRFSQVRIGSRLCSAVVAFSAGGLGQEEVYQALTGGTV